MEMPEQPHPELSVIQRSAGFLARFSSCRTHSTDILTLLMPQLLEGVRQQEILCQAQKELSTLAAPWHHLQRDWEG